MGIKINMRKKRKPRRKFCMADPETKFKEIVYTEISRDAYKQKGFVQIPYIIWKDLDYDYIPF